ncbi:MAG: hypothetical protein K8H86_10085 [Ignavibacteriaceae bacterium]|nr:hypothetical protein [Ignavibacteriaceae bacterium]
MKTIKKLMRLFKKEQPKHAPLLIIKKEANISGGQGYDNIKEYLSVEDAIADIENDSNVPADKIEMLKTSLKNLKNRTSIKIKNGEIII